MKKLISLCLVLALLFSHAAFAGMSLEDLLERGGNYAVNGEFEKAGTAFEIALKMESENISVYRAIAHMCILKGDLESALSALDAALKIAPSEGEMYLDKAHILFELERIRQAEEALLYAEVLGEEPNDEIWVSAYNAYYAKSEYERVIDAYENMSDNALIRIDMEKYTRALVRTGQTELAQALGLIEIGAKDALIQDAIENGRKISLVPAELENVLAYPVFISEDMYNQIMEDYPEDKDLFPVEPAEDGKRVRFTEEALQNLFGDELTMEDVGPITASPSGNIHIYNIDGNAYIVKNHELTMIGLNEDRSVATGEDDLENAYRVLYQLCYWIEQNGVAWSKDERYFVLSYPTEYLMAMRGYDLLYVDVETGDLIQANSTPETFNQEGFEHAHLAAFDEAGENIYYYAFVNEDEDTGHTGALKKYNIETGDIETLTHYEDGDIYYPNLYLTADHEIKGTYSPNKPVENGGIISFKETTDGWTYEKEEFGEVSRYQSPRGYFANEDSGMEVVFNQIENAIGYLTVANEKLDAPGHNKMILLPVNGNQAYVGDIPSEESVETEEFMNAWGGYFAFGYSKNEPQFPAPEYMNVREMTLSPDGYYALLVTQYPEANEYEMYFAVKTGLCLLDLQTLKYSTIECPESASGFDINSYDFMWNERNEIMLPTHYSNLYTLKID